MRQCKVIREWTMQDGEKSYACTLMVIDPEGKKLYAELMPVKVRQKEQVNETFDELTPVPDRFEGSLSKMSDQTRQYVMTSTL